MMVQAIKLLAFLVKLWADHSTPEIVFVPHHEGIFLFHVSSVLNSANSSLLTFYNNGTPTVTINRDGVVVGKRTYRRWIARDNLVDIIGSPHRMDNHVVIYSTDEDCLRAVADEDGMDLIVFRRWRARVAVHLGARSAIWRGRRLVATSPREIADAVAEWVNYPGECHHDDSIRWM